MSREKFLDILVASMVVASPVYFKQKWVPATKISYLCNIEPSEFVTRFKKYSKNIQWGAVAGATHESFSNRVELLIKDGAHWNEIFLPAEFIREVLLHHLKMVEFTFGQNWDNVTMSTIELGRCQLTYSCRCPFDLFGEEEIKSINERKLVKLLRRELKDGKISSLILK